MTTDTTIARTIHTTASGLLIYIDADTGMAACVGIDGLRIAHARELAVGCHPYAIVTAWIGVDMLPTITEAPVNVAEDAVVLDWCDWCDDVFARYAEHSAEESIASSAQQAGAITSARYLDEINATLAAEEASERAA
jgi:hypothetical protein